MGLKVIATLILLSVNKDVRDQPGWGAVLWWATKITPIIAVPCVIWIAWMQKLDQLWLFVALMLFVVVAVPLKIRQRRHRIVNRTAARPLA